MGRICVHEQVSDQTKTNNPVGGGAKRSFDLALASVTLVLTGPILVLVILAMKLSGRRQIFARHLRVGHRGQSFNCLEFGLTQAQSAHGSARVERFLRLSGISKLPQLLNVLRGEMSMIGPHPISPADIARYGDRINLYFSARPGVISVSEVCGTDPSCAKAVAMDTDYIRDWRFSTDLAILFRVITTLVDRSPKA